MKPPNFLSDSRAIRTALRVTSHPKGANLFIVVDLPNLLHTTMITVIVDMPEHFGDELVSSVRVSRGHSNVEDEAVFTDLDI